MARTIQTALFTCFYLGVTSGLDTETQAMTPDQLNIEDLMKSRDYFNQSQSSIQSHDQQYSQSENYTLQSHDLMQTTSEVRHSGAYVDSLEGTLDRPDMDQVDIDPDTYTDGVNTYGQTRSSLGLTEGMCTEGRITGGNNNNNIYLKSSSTL